MSRVVEAGHAAGAWARCRELDSTTLIDNFHWIAEAGTSIKTEREP